uniref:MFS domain-containing protein n=1 Tax=Heterorhabditis bacteriophora TaxID=37862 RepID=A0A1I7X7U5_HETBA
MGDKQASVTKDISDNLSFVHSRTKLQSNETPWSSIFTCAFMLTLTGVQMSVYFMSTWQYLSETDPTATIDFFGWVVAACSLGCAIANPLFGIWQQRTMSTKNPVTFGFSLSALGP